MIYTYSCECGSTLDIERSIHEDAIAPTCYDCKKTMARVWTPPVITFNGNGFYSTDNK